jgi:putative aminopeptidase FrvX
MAMDSTEKLLMELTEITGISGDEKDVARAIEKHLKPIAKISRDRLGSVICRKDGTAKAPRVMLAAHMDEVGFLVKQVTKEGYIKFIPIGGWFSQVILGQRVIVKTRKGEIVGVVGSKPPHELDEEERKKVVEIRDMHIDVGAARGFDVEKKLDVRPGDAIVPWSPFMTMGNPRTYLAKAWDDRIGCAIMIGVLRRLAKERHPNSVSAVGTVQEEVGLRGATTSAAVVDPDVAFALEVSIAHDTPGFGPEDAEALGAGPGILVYDRSMIPNRNLLDLAIDVATKHRIPYHLASVDKGGTDTGKIHMNRAGVPSLVIGVATRYIHSHIGVIHRSDYDNAVRLVTEIVRVLDARKVAAL